MDVTTANRLRHRARRALIVTRAVHEVHHSRWQPETDSSHSFLDRGGDAPDSAGTRMPT